MQISIAANGINVIGNCAGVFLLRMGGQPAWHGPPCFPGSFPPRW